MPSSHIYNVPLVMTAISNRHQSHARIKSILEVGIGWGKYGLLIREYLGMTDIMKPDDEWELRVDCVEVCQQYLHPFKYQLYSHIWPLDIRDFCKDPETWIHPWTWDLVLLLEILEHLPKEDGFSVINTLLNYSFWMVITTPKRMVPQPTFLYHEQEQHISLWSLKDFEEYEIDEIILDNEHTIGLVLRGLLWRERPPKR